MAVFPCCGSKEERASELESEGERGRHFFPPPNRLFSPHSLSLSSVLSSSFGSLRTRSALPPARGVLSPFLRTRAAPCDLSRGVSPPAQLPARAAAASASKVRRMRLQQGMKTRKRKSKWQQAASTSTIDLLARQPASSLCSISTHELVDPIEPSASVRGKEHPEGRKAAESDAALAPAIRRKKKRFLRFELLLAWLAFRRGIASAAMTWLRAFIFAFAARDRTRRSCWCLP